VATDAAGLMFSSCFTDPLSWDFEGYKQVEPNVLPESEDTSWALKQKYNI
jgi:hypothetical protein